MPLSYTLFVGLYALSVVVGIAAALLVIVGRKNVSFHKLFESAKYNLVYIAIIATAPLLVLLEHAFVSVEMNSKEVVYTNWLFSIGGNAITILQDRLDYQILADLSIVIYVWVFAFVLYFTPILILTLDDRATFRRYSLAVLFNYVILLPFYIFFPVTVTGFYADSGMTPLLYIDSNWGRMVTSIDPLNNDFPSAHVSLVVTALLVLVYAGVDYRRYYYFVACAAVGITFSVLYLGVHWLADIFGGFALAVVAYMVSGNQRIQMALDRHIRALTSKIVKEK
ncbi:MAG: phosphatase PAP2 family protein [Candidatus Thermoplasmatota archaeon]|nr:phosphatase PAP2 family protein [Candidatus Thermoplasmatota archaeon]